MFSHALTPYINIFNAVSKLLFLRNNKIDINKKNWGA
jgi:hypothetical protein